MHIEHLVSVCLDAIAQGDSVETCLARFPAEAEELEPLLRVAAMLQAQPKPKLSSHAFLSGRSALAAAARAAQGAATGSLPQLTAENSDTSAPTAEGHTGSDNHAGSDNHIGSRKVLDRYGPALPLHSPQDVIHENGHHTADDRANGFGGSKASGLLARFPSQSAANQPVRRGWPPRTQTQLGPYQVQSPAASRSGKRFRFYHIVTMAASILLVLGGATLLQQSAQGRLGAPLAAVRTLGQQVEGLLMNAAGEGASWHARQTLLQLESFHMATTGGGTLTEQLRSDIENHVQQALLAASRLSTEEQERFYADWLADLAVAQTTMSEADPDAITLLEEVMAQVTTASNGVNILEVTPVETPTEETALPLLMPTTVPTTISTTTAEAETATSVATSSATASPSPSPTSDNGAAEVAPAAVNGGNGNARATDVPVVATRVLLATAVPTFPPTATPQRRVQTAATATLAPTITPLPVITRVMPRQTEESERHHEALDESATSGVVDEAPTSSAPAPRADGSDNDAGHDIGNDGSEDETSEDETSEHETVPITETMFAPGGTIPQPTATEPATGEDEQITPDDLTAMPTVTPWPSATSTPEPATEPPSDQTGTPAVTVVATATAVTEEKRPPDTTATAVDEALTMPPNTATWTPVARATVDETTAPPVEATPEATVDVPGPPPTEAVVTHSRRPTAESVSVTPNPTATPQPTATNEPTRAQQPRRARNNDPDTAATATPAPVSTTGAQPTGNSVSIEQPTAEVTSVPASVTSDPVGG